MEDLKKYLVDFVEPTVADFRNNPTSIRHGFLACVTVFHSIDYLAAPRSSRTLRQRFNRQSPEFEIVDKVAHAFKHVVSSRSDGSIRAADILSRPPMVWGKAVWNLSRWDDSVGGVTISQNREIDLLEAIEGAVRFLYQQLKDDGAAN